MQRVTFSFRTSIDRSRRALRWPGRTACALIASFLLPAFGCGGDDTTRVGEDPRVTPEVDRNATIRVAPNVTYHAR